MQINSDKRLESITLGGGCFWCIESLLSEIEGVIRVTSGYEGGVLENPTYHDVCNGNTLHAEVCQVEFDPEKVSLETLLQIFWCIHDPTTLNRQGNDVGTQYRSVIFYNSEDQLSIALSVRKEMEEAKLWPNPMVTEISPSKIFYPAEEYHQNYYARNSSQSYCVYVIKPKLEKFRKAFELILKK